MVISGSDPLRKKHSSPGPYTQTQRAREGKESLSSARKALSLLMGNQLETEAIFTGCLPALILSKALSVGQTADIALRTLLNCQR